MRQAQGYVIRHQKRGLMVDKIYLKPPSPEEFRARTAELEEGWAQIVPVTLEGPDFLAHLFDNLDPLPATETTSPPAPEMLKMTVAAKGIVAPRAKR